jgi:hypothetical protein
MTPAAYVTAARRRLAGMGRRSRYLAMSQSMQAGGNLVLRAALLTRGLEIQARR